MAWFQKLSKEESKKVQQAKSNAIKERQQRMQSGKTTLNDIFGTTTVKADGTTKSLIPTKSTTNNTNKVSNPPSLVSYPTSNKSSGSSGGSTVSSYSGTLRPYLDAMLSAFNQGADANKALDIIREQGFTAELLGEAVEGDKSVTIL